MGGRCRCSPGFEDEDAAQLAELGGVDLVVEGAGDAVFLVRLLDAGGLEIFQNHLRK